ncbi:hypothetical protein BD779DRAFT_1441672 [Infundibulicybe gibba]|nr:hypothetical protein BD779DRAFT_1441672 [Infundibulicybe gibba]
MCICVIQSPLSLSKQIRSLVKIVPTINIPELVSGPRRQQAKTKREDITTDHLPSAYRKGFRLQFIPLIRQYTSTLAPWEAPIESDIMAFFATVFDLEVEAVECDLVSIVTKLVDDRLSEWRNKFATAAMTALERLFDTLHLNTPEERAEYVGWLLGTDDKCCPFYYKECEPGETPGIFQSSLISATLGAHYILTASIDKLEQTSDTRPVGALVLAVQAVRFF